MEETIQFSQMDAGREDERPRPDKACLPQERTLWRMPDLAHPPRCVPTSFDIDSKPELIQGEHQRTLRRVEPILLQRQVRKRKNWLKNQSLLSIDQKKELEMTPALEKEGPMVSTSSKPASEVPKDNHKGSQENQRGLKNNKDKFQEKAHWHIPYPQGYRISKFEPWAMDSVLNVPITPMRFPEN
ncbi:hypothetical protein O181_096321 [Austropuccinia psidii MF-1]|uniref:Uncharacterized protein n=1 Tax=Austropuccinia psidii MF-1 TaxID=1389203 RepID=A0A9Q3J767_9BASI|nr:hypothetical protein [Austropuccinia psidii MF-1]